MPSTSPDAEDQRGNEDVFSGQLREAESHGVASILTKDGSPKAIFRILDSASGLAEMAYENVRDPNGRQVACKEGCSWCCHQTVGIRAPEAIRIAEFLRGMEDTAARDEMLAKLRDLDSTTRGISADARDKLRLACAFLKDGRCAIYSVRPLVCAEYTSFDVEDCIKAFHASFANTTIRCDKARWLAYKAVREGLNEGLAGALPKSDMALLELTAAVADALSSPEAAAEWRAGGPVFEKAHLMVEPE
jgi:Fe-S-cluster containining protein